MAPSKTVIIWALEGIPSIHFTWVLALELALAQRLGWSGVRLLDI